MAYDLDGYFVAEVEDVLGQRTQSVFEPRRGRVVRVMNALGDVTETRYDGFGRISRQTSADLRDLVVAYNHGGPASNGTDVAFTGASVGERHTFLDSLGRNVGERVVQPMSTSETRTYYDARGRVDMRAEPYLAGATPTIFSTTDYDILDRPRRIVDADGTAQTFTYLPWETRSHDGVGTTRVVRDGRGDVVAVVAADSTTTNYTYCRSGQVRDTTSPGGRVLMTRYDRLGRRVLLDEPETGVTESQYNALDQLVRVRDGAARVTELEYDDVGRLIERRHLSDGSWERFTFDTALLPNGLPAVGLLAEAASSDDVEDAFEYDEHGRVISQTRTIGGSAPMAYDYAYDSFGDLSALTTPSILTLGRVTFQFVRDLDSRGMTEVRRGSSPVWTLEAHDARGAATEEGIGALVRTTEFTQAGRIHRLTTRNGLTAVQDLLYTHDARGLVSHAANLATGVNESFEYDEIGRITKASDGLGPSRTFGYDGDGNITSTHDLTNLTFDGLATTQLTSYKTSSDTETIDYDDAGNATRVGGTNISWTGFGLPRQIDGSKSVTYQYDAFGHRARRTNLSSGETTTYFGPLYERVELQHGSFALSIRRSRNGRRFCAGSHVGVAVRESRRRGPSPFAPRSDASLS